MELKIQIILCIALYGKYADCATISAWTEPVIATGNGGEGIVSVSIPENTAVGATSITLAATGAATSGAWLIHSQIPTCKFSIHPDTGVLSVTSPPDREVAEYVVMVIMAKDTQASPGTASATVSVLITDLNDNTPACSSSTLLANVPHGSCSATVVTDVDMVDMDATSANNQIARYMIDGGNIGNRFYIESWSGIVKVAPGKTIWYDEADTYSLVIKGRDNGTPALIGSCTLKVYVCSAPTHSVSIITLFVALLASLR